MKVMIVQSQRKLGVIWSRHLERMGAIVKLVSDQDAAIDALCSEDFDVIIVDVVLHNGSALAVSDFASYRRPETRVIFVSNSSFFSDGSIFAHSDNACAFVPMQTRPEDLAAMVEYYANGR